ncbi:TPA: 3-deoxy-D-manno-octulosonic acid transferase, partial [Candidatus Galligastranaerophilus gallistercoris]|nr:3-deoxy-D-manno-octulosonic acid transferase [Candidatus Galligastranaerophilus gallistercoris]
VDIILLNVMGELSKLYAVSDVAFIGGSFNNTGGHNPLEAIIFNKPVVSGPSIKNFRDIYAILSSNSSGRVVKNKEEFFEYLYKLFSDENFYNKASKDCETIFNNQQGALDFVIDKLKACL